MGQIMDRSDLVYPEMWEWDWQREHLEATASADESGSSMTTMADIPPASAQDFIAILRESLERTEIVETFSNGMPAKLVPNGDKNHVYSHYMRYLRRKYGTDIPPDGSFQHALYNICDGTFPDGFEDLGFIKLMEKSPWIDCSSLDDLP